MGFGRLMFSPDVYLERKKGHISLALRWEEVRIKKMKEMSKEDEEIYKKGSKKERKQKRGN